MTSAQAGLFYLSGGNQPHIPYARHQGLPAGGLATGPGADSWHAVGRRRAKGAGTSPRRADRDDIAAIKVAVVCQALGMTTLRSRAMGFYRTWATWGRLPRPWRRCREMTPRSGPCMQDEARWRSLQGLGLRTTNETPYYALSVSSQDARPCRSGLVSGRLRSSPRISALPHRLPGPLRGPIGRHKAVPYTESYSAAGEGQRCQPAVTLPTLLGAIRLNGQPFPPTWSRCPHRCDVRPAQSSSPPWRFWSWW